VDEGEILDREVAQQASQPQEPAREPPRQPPCRWLVIDALVPELQSGGDADRTDDHDRGPDAAHYNRHRPHRARNLRPPDSDDLTVVSITDLATARIRRNEVLGGLINEYQRTA
jgi:hypothetical protein